MSDIILGQREIGMGDALTVDELEYLALNGVTPRSIELILGYTNSRMTLDAAIGGVLNMKKALEGGEEVADPRGLGIEPEKSEEVEKPE